MTSDNSFPQNSRDMRHVGGILDDPQTILSQADSDQRQLFSSHGHAATDTVNISGGCMQPASPESSSLGSPPVLAVTPPSEDRTDSEHQSLFSPASLDSSSLGSPPAFTISPPPEDQDNPDLLHDDPNFSFYRDSHGGRRFSDLSDTDLEICRLAQGPRRNSDTGPGKSRSPSRSSPRRHSPNPYSRRRTHSSGSLTSEDVGDVYLSPGRRSSLSVTPQNGYVTAEEYLTHDEEYLEVTVIDSDQAHISSQAGVEIVFSEALTMDSGDSCDVEMSVDTDGASDYPPADSGDAPPEEAHLHYGLKNNAPEVSESGIPVIGSDRNREIGEERQEGHEKIAVASLLHEQCLEDSADPFSAHSCDVALLTDDSSDDDLDISSSDKENTIDDIDIVLLQSSNDACCTVSSDVCCNSAVGVSRQTLQSHSQSCKAASKELCSYQCSHPVNHSDTTDQRCADADRIADSESSQLAYSPVADYSTSSFHQPGTGYSESHTCNTLVDKERRVAASHLSDLREAEHSCNCFSQRMAAASPQSSVFAEMPSSSPFSSSSFQHSSKTMASSEKFNWKGSSSCSCNGLDRTCQTRSCCSPNVTLRFPHYVDAVLLLPAQHNPYNPALPTPPVVLTPYSSYEKSLLPCPGEGHLEVEDVRVMEALQSGQLRCEAVCSVVCSEDSSVRCAAEYCFSAAPVGAAEEQYSTAQRCSQICGGVHRDAGWSEERCSIAQRSGQVCGGDRGHACLTESDVSVRGSCQASGGEASVKMSKDNDTGSQWSRPECSSAREVEHQSYPQGREKEVCTRQQDDDFQQQMDHSSKIGWWPHHQYHHHHNSNHHHSSCHHHHHNHQHGSHHSPHHYHHSHHPHHPHHHHHHLPANPSPQQTDGTISQHHGNIGMEITSNISAIINIDLGNATGSRGGTPTKVERTGENQCGPPDDAASRPNGPGPSPKDGNSRAALLGHLRRVVERRLSSSEDPSTGAPGH